MKKKRCAEIDEMLKVVCMLTERMEALKLEPTGTTQETINNLNNAYNDLRDAAYELEMIYAEERGQIIVTEHCAICKSDSSCSCPCLTCKHDDGREGDCCIRHHIKCNASECKEYEKEDTHDERDG